MHKLILRLLTSAALAIAMPALADDAKPLAGQSITVLMPSPQGPTIAADFEAETGIHVDLQTLSWDDIRPKLVTALVAGTAPADVTEFDWSWTGQFSAAGWFLPLNDVIDADSVKDIGVAKIFTVDGKLLGVPYTNDFRVMLINKKHFADAGVSEMPKTLDDLVVAAKKIKEKGITQYPIGLPVSATEGASTSWYLLTKAFGGELFDKDFNPLFTSPDSAGYKALAFELMLLKEGLVDPASTGLKDSQINESMFGQGITSIMISGEPGRLGQMNDPKQSKVAGQVEAILVPTASGETRSFGLPEALAIPNVSQNKDAAIAFVKWFTSKDFQKKNAANGFLPTRTSALSELNQDGKLNSGDVLVAQSKTVEPLFPQGTPPWYPQFSSGVNTAINSAAKGQMSVDQAMEAIAAAAKQARAQ
ncbi:sugar ABC transporter substrate-binding protein [Rhizobium redzepovicii]|uniref:Sugar ABC transporter substrate-binding protein n=1 Tax=Rhizobium redzepovicii TaxID=2867518 RepID=A0AAW8P783_9HYPH|nr:sugar ABC transporter substrate-binding protein [Rhizobium redzepovicii]MDR9762903.1 sugar ABC transporter substrate-binding protein [Rhizobium redzepovicii]MDR9780893.1 sugar ABC transporter substrate-binding protein [Rhizobium redzepovicii]